MERKRRLWLGLAAATCSAVLWSACKDQTTTEPTERLEQLDEGRMLESVAGIQVSEARMRALLNQVTREVALALNDPQARAGVHAALRESPYEDNKVHFGTLVRRGGRELLAGMASVRGSDPGAVLATLDSILDLEFFMPVPEHRERWDGGPALMVGSSLLGDAAVPPAAFDLAGRGLEIGIKQAPATPTLFLVRAQTDFSVVPVPASAVAASAATSARPAGYYMISSHIFNIRRWQDCCFWNRKPELEIFELRGNLRNQSLNDDYGVPTDCSGRTHSFEYGGFRRRYDQNESRWPTNNAYDGSRVLVVEGGGSRLPIGLRMVERDNGSCDRQRPHTDEAQILGDLVLACPRGATSNTANYEIRRGTEVTGRVVLERVGGTITQPVCALQASITGPGRIYVTSWRVLPPPRYVASVSGGSGSISYEWRDNGVLKSRSSTYTMSPVIIGNHTIQLRVTRGGRSVTRNKTVSVIANCGSRGCAGFF